MTKIQEYYQNIFKGTFDETNDFWQQIGLNFLVMIIFSAIFGFIVGTYEGGIQLLYVAVKVPLLMLITTIITFPFMAISGLAVDTKIKFKFLFQIINFGLTQTAMMMLALVPLMWVFVQGGDYRLNIIALTGIFMISGAFGIIRNGVVIYNKLKLSVFKIILLAALCGISYTFVAGQVWWLMRPWVGYTVKEEQLPFIRSLDEDEISNVYESIQTTSNFWYNRKVLNKGDSWYPSVED